MKFVQKLVEAPSELIRVKISNPDSEEIRMRPIRGSSNK